MPRKCRLRAGWRPKKSFGYQRARLSTAGDIARPVRTMWGVNQKTTAKYESCCSALYGESGLAVVPSGGSRKLK